MREFRPLLIPRNTHPLVTRLFQEMNHNQIGILDMAKRSGVNKNTINDWKRRSMPRIDNLDACYAALGMKLTIGVARYDAP